MTSNLDAKLESKIKQIPGVKDAVGSLMDVVSFEDANLTSVLMNGWQAESLLFRGLGIRQGRALRPGDGRVAMLGRVLAMNLGKRVGDILPISGETYEVIGIYESESLFENGGLIVPLKELQRRMGREGDVSGFVVSARATGLADVAKRRRDGSVEVRVALNALPAAEGRIRFVVDWRSFPTEPGENARCASTTLSNCSRLRVGSAVQQTVGVHG